MDKARNGAALDESHRSVRHVDPVEVHSVECVDVVVKRPIRHSFAVELLRERNRRRSIDHTVIQVEYVKFGGIVRECIANDLLGRHGVFVARVVESRRSGRLVCVRIDHSHGNRPLAGCQR